MYEDASRNSYLWSTRRKVLPILHVLVLADSVIACGSMHLDLVALRRLFYDRDY
jgi:hypothetical protein